MAILTSADFPSIRRQLDTWIDADQLPDEVIADPTNEPLAELWVLRQDPLAATRTGTDAAYVKLATIYYAASLIALTLPAITTIKTEDGASLVRSIDWKARSAELRGLAEAAIDAVLNPTAPDTADRPTAFVLACSGRSGLPGRAPAGIGRWP